MNLPASLRRIDSDCGQTLIEAALSMLMVIVVVLSTIEIGRMLLVYTTIADAARAGARYAVVHGDDRTGSGVNGPSSSGSSGQVQNVVNTFAGPASINTANLHVTVAYPDGNNSPGSRVSVSVTYAYDPLISYFNNYLSVNLSSTSEGVISF